MASATPRASQWSEAWARALIASSRDVVWVRTVDGVLVYASPAVEATLGYPPEELEGRSERDLIHQDERESAATSLSSGSLQVMNPNPPSNCGFAIGMARSAGLR